MTPERSNRGNTSGWCRIRFGQVPQGDIFEPFHATASTRYRNIFLARRNFPLPPIYPYRERKRSDRWKPHRTWGLICLPIRPIVIPNTWGGYDPVHHPYLRRFGGVRPCSIELVNHCIPTMLVRHPQYANNSNIRLTCPICSVILRHGENKGAVTNEV